MSSIDSICLLIFEMAFIINIKYYVYRTQTF
jgi:hypothetical protein